MEKKSIISDKPVVFQTPAEVVDPKVGWRVHDFNELIMSQGYDALIDRALRCPCVDRATGQALSTCKNCLGRGWFFVDRRETRIIAQHMDNKKRYQDWSEINRGTSSITTRGTDKLGFMDRIILTQLEAYYSEVINPILFQGKIIAYPVYEPLFITNIYLFSSDDSHLVPVDEKDFIVSGNKIEFSLGIQDLIEVRDVNISNVSEIPISISIRYAHYPVFHVIDANRELMRVREQGCAYSDEQLKDMPINVLARKAHYIFDSQKFGEEGFENSVIK